MSWRQILLSLNIFRLYFLYFFSYDIPLMFRTCCIHWKHHLGVVNHISHCKEESLWLFSCSCWQSILKHVQDYFISALPQHNTSTSVAGEGDVVSPLWYKPIVYVSTYKSTGMALGMHVPGGGWACWWGYRSITSCPAGSSCSSLVPCIFSISKYVSKISETVGVVWFPCHVC